MNSIGKKGLAKISFLIFAFGFFIFAHVVFTEGLPSPHISQWAVKYGLSHDALYIVNIAYVFASFFLLYGFLKRIFYWTKGNLSGKGYLLLADISIITFLLYGYFELGVLVSGWHLTLVRVIIISPVFMSYLAYSSGPKEKKQKVFEV